jgi:hypothetical protein
LSAARGTLARATEPSTLSRAERLARQQSPRLGRGSTNGGEERSPLQCSVDLCKNEAAQRLKQNAALLSVRAAKSS